MENSDGHAKGQPPINPLIDFGYCAHQIEAHDLHDVIMQCRILELRHGDKFVIAFEELDGKFYVPTGYDLPPIDKVCHLVEKSPIVVEFASTGELAPVPVFFETEEVVFGKKISGAVTGKFLPNDFAHELADAVNSPHHI